MRVLLLALAIISLTFATKVVIINDLHLDPFFDPHVSVQDDCRGPNPFRLMNIKDSDFAPYGRYGCDVSTTLINLFMGRIKEVAGDADVIVVSGDYTAHDIAAKRGRANANYAMLKSIINQCFTQYMGPLFPKAVVVPAIGNNDVKFHYEFPTTEEDREDYYGFLYNLWFEQMDANRNYTKKDEVRKTLMNGGYFVYEHSETLSFMAINSLYFSVKNVQFNSSVSHEQLDWIESTLRDSEENRKFILNMHVFPGMYNPGERQQFWLDEFTNRFDDIMRKYGDKVLLMNGAHTHISDVRASWEYVNSTSIKNLLKGQTVEKRPYYANFVSPSFSPYYLNNPGFTTFNVDDGRIWNVTTHFMQLDKTYSQSKCVNDYLYSNLQYS